MVGLVDRKRLRKCKCKNLLNETNRRICMNVLCNTINHAYNSTIYKMRLIYNHQVFLPKCLFFFTRNKNLKKNQTSICFPICGKSINNQIMVHHMHQTQHEQPQTKQHESIKNCWWSQVFRKIKQIQLHMWHLSRCSCHYKPDK